MDKRVNKIFTRLEETNANGIRSANKNAARSIARLVRARASSRTQVRACREAKGKGYAYCVRACVSACVRACVRADCIIHNSCCVRPVVNKRSGARTRTYELRACARLTCG